MSTKHLIGEHVVKRRRLVVVSERYSRFVGLMKFVLPVSAIVLTVLVVTWPHLDGHERGAPLSFAKVEAITAEALYVKNARYFGSDESDQPFIITADSVVQETGDPDTIRFMLPKADILLADGTWLALTAERGTLHRDDQTLTLDGRVNIFSDEGYEFHTERAEVDLRANVAHGSAAIEGQGPFGVLNATAFRVDNEKRSIFFEGRVRLVLYPKTGV